MALSKMQMGIHIEEIETFCIIKQEKATSIEIMEHLLGGPNMEYTTMEVENSFECYDFLIKKFDRAVENAHNLWYFEAKNFVMHL